MKTPTDTVIAVFLTDAWHSHISRELVGTATSADAAIACVRHHMKEEHGLYLSK